MVFFIRHGQTDCNKNHIIQGQKTNAPLNDLGKEQAKEVADVFENIPIDHIISSPLKRARQTAEIIADQMGIDEVKIEPIFIERDYGGYEGTISHNYPFKFYFTPMDRNAENDQALYKRFLEGIKKLSDLKGNTIVVTHGGISGNFVWNQTGDDSFRLVNTSVIAVEPKTQKLLGFNLNKKELEKLYQEQEK